MATLRIRIDGLEKVIAKYGRAAAQRAMTAALESTVHHGADLVKMKTPVKSGFLRSQIKGEVQTTKTGRTFAIGGSGVYYAKFVEKGTGVYGPRRSRVRPVRAKALSWHSTTVTGKPTANRVTVSSTRGQRPQRMFERTFREDRVSISRHFNEQFQRRFFF